jgi:hypothetical protein
MPQPWGILLLRHNYTKPQALILRPHLALLRAAAHETGYKSTPFSGKSNLIGKSLFSQAVIGTDRASRNSSSLCLAL